MQDKHSGRTPRSLAVLTIGEKRQSQCRTQCDSWNNDSRDVWVRLEVETCTLNARELWRSPHPRCACVDVVSGTLAEPAALSEALPGSNQGCADAAMLHMIQRHWRYFLLCCCFRLLLWVTGQECGGKRSNPEGGSAIASLLGNVRFHLPIFHPRHRDSFIGV